MTHDNQGKRWPPTAGVEADFITVDTRGAGSAAATRLRLYGIPHSTVYACKPPVLEGWSFSVYNGAEEHASGWGSTSLADMAPALLAAVGMTDAATAHKRAQTAETRTIDLAGERDAAVEALDTASDMIGKLCTVMAGAGFDGDLLSAVGDLIESRNNAIKSRDSKQRELVEVRDALGPSRTADSVSVLAKRMRASLNRWEAVTRELAAGNPTLAVAVSVEDLADRHFDLRLALTNEVDRLKRELVSAHDQIRDISHILGPRRTERDLPSAKVIEESVVSQAERARAILDRWQDLACKFLPACPQLSHALCGADLGTRHFELRGYLEGEINALRTRLSLAAEREDLIIAALGHPCSTNGIPEAVRLLRRDAERWLTECGEVGARAAAYSAENVRLSTQRDDARAEVTAVRKALVVPEGVNLVDHAAEIVRREAKMREVFEARNHVSAELTKPLRIALGWSDLGLTPESVVEAAATSIADLSGRLSDARSLPSKWQTWGRNKIGVTPTVSDENLRNAIDESGGRVDALSAEVQRLTLKSIEQLTTITNERTAHAKTFAQLQEAYDAMNNGHEALTADAKEALYFLIAHPGRGLTSELACEGAKRLRRHIEHGLPATQPLRSLLDLALFSGVNAAHEMWDAEIQRTRDEGVQMRKRLDQWVAWGCRAACLNAAPDEALRSEIDKALPMWRRGARQD